MRFNIFIPTLKRLTINSDYKFMVRTRNLEYLKITSSMCYLKNDMPFICKALVKVGKNTNIYRVSRDEANCAMELLRGINNTEFLSLSVFTMAALRYARDGDFPTFPNLKHLDLGSGSGWKLLPHFLSNSPNLKRLILHKGDQCIRDEYGEAVSGNFGGDELDSVPSCLLLHLKCIEISYSRSRGLEDGDLEVAKYLLKNSEILEKFHLYCFGPVSRSIRKVIRSCPKGSKACKIIM